MIAPMKYTVKQLADLAGVTKRTLHYYDEIGLLKPSTQGCNRYRYYDEDALLRLQQILFYRELGLRLEDIKAVLDQPDFDLARALREHRRALLQRSERLQRLIRTVDETLDILEGRKILNEKTLFGGFSEEEQAVYAEEARRKYGPELVDESMRRWKSYSQEQKQQILAEGNAIYSGIAAAMDQGADSPEVQELIARWHQHLRHFYEPTPAMLRGLGQMYAESLDFRARFETLHPDLPDFLNAAIQIYCERL